MKKVIVLVVTLTLLAGSAFALTIVNSKHDLSSGSTSGGPFSTNYDEVCVFCHTPHAADLTVTLAPLWNRSHPGTIPAVGDLYNSATLESTSQPTQVRANIINSDATLCLSCHDGSTLGSALVNPLNVENGDQPTFGGTPTVGADANISGDTDFLKNDHPIGMNYGSSQSTDSGLILQSTVEADGLQFYGNVLWCSTCHDVHDNANVPFLAMNNAGSDLCLTCHNK